MKKLITALLAIVAVSAAGETFNTKDQFSITLPDGWVKIPRTALDDFARHNDQRTPDRPSHYYDFGYQLSPTNGWFSYPYILVQVLPYGRMPSGVLKRLETAHGGAGKMDALQASEFIPGTSVGKRIYDDAHHMLWTTMNLDTVSNGTIKAMVGIRLTETGLIRLTGCATEQTFDKYSGVFKKAFANLDIDKAIRYKPRITDTAPVIGHVNVGEVLIWFFQAVVIGGILWLIYFFIKRKLLRNR